MSYKKVKETALDSDKQKGIHQLHRQELLEHSCFSIELRHGTITIGVLEIIVAVLSVGAAFYPGENPSNADSHQTMIIIEISIAVLGVTVGTLLIIAASMEKAWMALPWMIKTIVMLILICLGCIYLLITNPDVVASIVLIFWSKNFDYLRVLQLDKIEV